jgi:hypothetical protein
VLGGGAQDATGGQPHEEDLAAADGPYLVAARDRQAVVGVEGHHVGLRADEVADRGAAAVREDDERVTGDALAEIREHRPLVRPRLDAARELRQGDHRDVELARQDLQAAGHLADLLHAVLDARVRPQQLQVVEDDQAQAAVLGHRLLVQAARLRADVEDADVRGVVDEQRRPRVLAGDLQHALPLGLVAQAPLAQVVALDRGLAGDEALRQLGLAHLEAEQRHGPRLVAVQRDVLGDVRDQRRLPHARSCRDDDHVAGLEAAGDRVEVAEAGGRAGHGAALGGELLPLRDLRVEDVADLDEVLLAVVVGDLEHHALGTLDELARLGLVVVDGGLDLVGGAEQAAQERELLDDRAVAPQVADGGDGPGQRVDLGAAADVLELAARAQVLGDGQDVDRLALLIQREHRLVQHAMAVAVEVLRLEALLDDERVVDALGEQDRAEDRLLGLDGVGRRAGGGGSRPRAIGVAVPGRGRWRAHEPADGSVRPGGGAGAVAAPCALLYGSRRGADAWCLRNDDGPRDGARRKSGFVLRTMSPQRSSQARTPGRREPGATAR